MHDLARRFIPAADETWRLQRGGDPEARFFQRFADEGHYKGEGGTRQGIYAVTPAGKLLGSLNSLDPERVAAMLENALEEWESLPEEERLEQPDASFKPEHRWESSYPADGLVLISAKRDVSDCGDPEAERSPIWNRDYAWFSPREARGFLPPEPEAGAVWEVPESLTRRLARFHVVDNVIGQTLPFAPSEVKGSELRATVLSADEERVTLRLEGGFRGVARGPWLLGASEWQPRAEHPRGVRGDALGFAEYDRGRQRFTRFDLVVLAQRWGWTGNNGRRQDPEPGPMIVAFRLAPDTPAARIAPAFVDLYQAGWIARPGAAAGR